MSHVSELWEASLIFGPLFTILFGISTSSLVLGFTKYDECPFQPLLPQGLIGFGLLGLICSIIALILVSSLFYQSITILNRLARNLKKRLVIYLQFRPLDLVS